MRRQCVGACQQLKTEAEFTPSEWQHAAWRNSRGKCRQCMERSVGRWRCQACKILLATSSFSKWLTHRTDKWKSNGNQICDDCTDKAQVSPIMQLPQGWWQCSVCQKQLERAEFRTYVVSHPSVKKHQFVRCNACEGVHAESEQKKRLGNLTHVQTRTDPKINEHSNSGVHTVTSHTAHEVDSSSSGINDVRHVQSGHGSAHVQTSATLL